jgi:hypothetical protein
MTAMPQSPRKLATSTQHRRDLLPHEEMLMFHQHSGPVYDTLDTLCERLNQARIEHVIIGAFALGCHGYERATTDVDLCLRKEDLERFRKEFVGREYEAVPGRSRRFQDPRTGVTFDLLVSGNLAGRTSRNDVIQFPDPSEAVTLKGLPTVSLERLIELKLVTWRLRDWADVIELIRVNKLDESFANHIHPLIRMAYLECYDQKVDEDRYEREA